MLCCHLWRPSCSIWHVKHQHTKKPKGDKLYIYIYIYYKIKKQMSSEVLNNEMKLIIRQIYPKMTGMKQSITQRHWLSYKHKQQTESDSWKILSQGLNTRIHDFEKRDGVLVMWKQIRCVLLAFVSAQELQYCCLYAIIRYTFWHRELDILDEMGCWNIHRAGMVTSLSYFETENKRQKAIREMELLNYWFIFQQ